MDTDNLIAQTRARFDHESAKRTLREKYQGKLTFAYCGGMFTAGPELINILNTCPWDEAVVLDLYENPVKVAPIELKHLAEQRWKEQMNAWLVEYEELNKNR